MKHSLSENIRRLRKERNLTQERLAEALGVTVGAVYKWESGQSQPEISMLMEIADFFDTSVDLLLGYQPKDNRLEASIERITAGIKTMDHEALREAEKVLAKYPHSFLVVYNCARIYLVFGCLESDPALLKQAIKLLEQARILLPQNRDPKVNDLSICKDLATALFWSGEREKGVTLLKENNVNGVYSCVIGAFLSCFMQRPEEAVPYLSEALVENTFSLLDTIFGYVFVFYSRKDWDSALAILEWGMRVLTGLKTEKDSGVFERYHAELLALLAVIQRKMGQEEAAAKALSEAAMLACHFDSQPDYSIAIRFADPAENSFAFDALGRSTKESVATLFTLLNEPDFLKQ